MPARLPLHSPSRFLLIPVALSMLLALAACGSGNTADEPTATSAPVASPTLAPGEVSVDSLLDRIDAAWPGVTSMVSTSWSGQYADPMQAIVATPPTDQMVTVEKVVKPAARSISTSIGGVAVDDQLAVNGVVYFRGQSVTNAIAPFMDASTWVRVDPTMVAEDSPVGQQLAYLTSPLDPPYGTVSDDLRAQGATKTGQVTVGGRACDVYTFTDATTGSEGIAYTLSLDSAGLPCSLTQSAGGYANVTTWTFNDLTITITPPADAVSVTGTPTSAP
ncbi:MAG: hypothetical protein ACTHMX_13410 [Thermomicrobiales bacterium]